MHYGLHGYNVSIKYMNSIYIFIYVCNKCDIENMPTFNTKVKTVLFNTISLNI